MIQRRHFLKSATLGAIASGLAGWGARAQAAAGAASTARVPVLPLARRG